MPANTAHTVRVIAAPGFPTDLMVTVLAVEPRAIMAVSLGGGVERYTLRRNGKFARKGGDQWSNYLDMAA